MVKRGVGKTTLAVNLAIAFAHVGRDVLLIDGDEQETAPAFTELRTTQKGTPGYTAVALQGAALRTQARQLAPKYADIIIDTGGRDTASQRAALAVADLLLVPFVPRSFDVWTIEKVAVLVEEMGIANQRLEAATFLNRADARGQDNDEAAGVLKDTPTLKYLNLAIGTRKAFGTAAAAGLAVTELKPQDPKASDEITALYRYVFSINQKSIRNHSHIAAGGQ